MQQGAGTFDKPALELLGDASRDDRLVATLALDFDVRHVVDGAPAQAVVVVASLATYRELLAQLRARSNAPAVLLLPEGDVLDRVYALEYGADDVLVAPYDASELLARLRALLRRVDRASPEILAVHDLEIDLQRRTVRRGPRTISLSRTELALLTTLARYRGAVVPNDVLSTEVWGARKAVNLVHTFISYVRTKVDCPGETPLVQTVRGIGYALRPEAG